MPRVLALLYSALRRTLHGYRWKTLMIVERNTVALDTEHFYDDGNDFDIYLMSTATDVPEAWFVIVNDWLWLVPSGDGWMNPRDLLVLARDAYLASRGLS